MFKHNKGFTLIELLVVISIVSLLSSIVLASLKSARLKARDAERISEVSQLRKALELYYLTFGQYPVTAGWNNSADASWNTGTNPLYALVTNGLISELPTDPINNNTGASAPASNTYGYGYFSANYPSASPNGGGRWYMIVVNLEGSHPQEASDGVFTCSTINPVATANAQAGQFHYGNNTTDHRLTLGGHCTGTRLPIN